ncbi:MAG: T9SS type A sorting domain-containing protein [Candidatus Paceibacterota bacterium]
MQINNALMVAGGHYQVPVIFSGDSIVGVESTIFSSDRLSFDFESRNTVTLNEWYWNDNYSYPLLSYDPTTNHNTIHWGLFSDGIFHSYFTPVRISVIANQYPDMANKTEEYIIFGQTIFTKSNLEHTQYYASGSSAKITVFNDGVWGGDNGTLDIFRILDFSTGKIMVIDQKSLAYYDVTGDLQVSSQDALYRTWKHFNVISYYPVENGYYYEGGCGLGINTTKGEVALQQLSNNTIKLIFSDSLTNGDLNLKLPKGAWIEKGSLSKTLNSVNTKDGVTKISFATNDALDKGSYVIINGAKLSEIEVNGTLNNGKPIILKPSGVTDVTEEVTSVPTKFDLSQNYPNPFNPSTTISYALPASGFVTLKVYDMLGKEVVELVNEEKPAGSYETKFDASQLASGMYIYKIQSGNFSQTKKMILMK